MCQCESCFSSYLLRTYLRKGAQGAPAVRRASRTAAWTAESAVSQRVLFSGAEPQLLPRSGLDSCLSVCQKQNEVSWILIEGYVMVRRRKLKRNVQISCTDSTNTKWRASVACPQRMLRRHPVYSRPSQRTRISHQGSSGPEPTPAGAGGTPPKTVPYHGCMAGAPFRF